MQIVFPSLSQITGRGIFFIKIFEHLLSGKEIVQIENNMYYKYDIFFYYNRATFYDRRTPDKLLKMLCFQTKFITFWLEPKAHPPLAEKPNMFCNLSIPHDRIGSTDFVGASRI